jgi:hypothetical protein
MPQKILAEGSDLEEELKLKIELMDSVTDSIYLHDFEENFI